MSLLAVATVLTHLGLAGTSPQPDEGTAAHVWQILMAGQLPIVLCFAIRWLPQAPRSALQVLALQAAAAVAALAPVYLLHWSQRPNRRCSEPAKAALRKLRVER
jgi:hypothetical protein